MGIFDFLKAKESTGKFVSESDYQKNHDNQMSMTPQTLEQLRILNVSDDQELKLEFFFYTNTIKKAEELSQELSNMGYSVEHGKSAEDKRLYIITGWTSKIPMIDNKVKQWTSQMCEIGYKFDCDFDGWGTNPEQD